MILLGTTSLSMGRVRFCDDELQSDVHEVCGLYDLNYL